MSAVGTNPTGRGPSRMSGVGEKADIAPTGLQVGF